MPKLLLEDEIKNQIGNQIGKSVKRIQRENVLENQKEYIKSLRGKEEYNKRSLWLNFIAFFIPVIGIFFCFYNLLKRPKRAKSVFFVCLISFILQFSFLYFSYMFLFDYLGNLCITIFG